MNPTRLVALDDAPVLAELLRLNRDFLAPWEPIRDEDYFTTDGQRAILRADLAQHAQESKLPHVIVDSGNVIGRITLNGIVRGPFQSCSLGYWVSASHNGRGFATRAVREIVRVAFEELRLHRVQAETLLHNTGSQRVLKRNGFLPIGLAPAYLNIAGEWQDMALFQVVNDAGRQADRLDQPPSNGDSAASRHAKATTAELSPIGGPDHPGWPVHSDSGRISSTSSPGRTSTPPWASRTSRTGTPSSRLRDRRSRPEGMRVITDPPATSSTFLRSVAPRT